MERFIPSLREAFYPVIARRHDVAISQDCFTAFAKTTHPREMGQSRIKLEAAAGKTQPRLKKLL